MKIQNLRLSVISVHNYNKRHKNDHESFPEPAATPVAVKPKAGSAKGSATAPTAAPIPPAMILAKEF